MKPIETIITPMKVVQNYHLKPNPKKINYNKLRQEALANILGQSNKDYFILQHTNNSKEISPKLADAQGRKFFENTLWY